MKVVSSAPGKLMLLGEHAVVYGFPCIVAAIDKRIEISAELSVTKKDIIKAYKITNTTFVKKAIAVFKKKYDINQSIQIETRAEFSDKIGFGSSAAVTVAVVYALAILFGKKLSRRQLFDLCYDICLSVQGSGSGFDVAASVFGNVLFYANQGKIIKPLDGDKLDIIVSYSGKKAKTADLIKQVAKLYRTNNSFANNIFSEIKELVEKAQQAIESKDFITLGRLMTKNHQLLQKLGISTSKLDRIVLSALNAGAYGAKLSGAGGGDCMIAIASPEKRQKIENAIKRAGGELIAVEINVKGVYKN